MNTRSLRFARRMGESYPCPQYANPFDIPQKRRRLTSRTFWIAAFLVVAILGLTA